MKGEITEMENGWTSLGDPKEIVSRVYWIRKESSFRTTRWEIELAVLYFM